MQVHQCKNCNSRNTKSYASEKRAYLECRAADFVALVLLVVVGHLEAGPDKGLHLLLVHAEHRALRTRVLALV